jgi:hypothetical protein
LFNRDLDFSFLRVIGCLCFPYLRPYNENKLQPRALPCVFLGYAYVQKSYKCLYVPTNKIYISRHVTFNETEFPFKSGKFLFSDTDISPQPEIFISPLQLSNWANKTNSAPIQSHEPATLPTQAVPNSPTPLPSPTFPFSPVSAHFEIVPEPYTPATASLPFSPQQDIPHPFSSSPTPQQQSSSHHMVTRTRDNTRRPQQFPDHVAFLTTLDHKPSTFSQANNHEHWRQAMAQEISALAHNKTWILVPPSLDQHVIGSKWVFKVKRHSDGSIERHKARLIARGFCLPLKNFKDE